MSQSTHLTFNMKPRDEPFNIHPRYGQVYKMVGPSNYDYVIVQGQLYWLDDEDLIQVGQTKSIELSVQVLDPLTR